MPGRDCRAGDGRDSARRATPFCRDCVRRPLYPCGKAGLKRSGSRDYDGMETCLSLKVIHSGENQSDHSDHSDREDCSGVDIQRLDGRYVATQTWFLYYNKK